MTLWKLPVRNFLAQLSCVLERFSNTKTAGSSDESLEYFGFVVSAELRHLIKGAWIFQVGKYGDFLGAAKVVGVSQDVIPRALKLGPDVLNNIDCLGEASDSACQLVLMDFWAEVGHGKTFLSRLRDQLKPIHESIIYFRIKNGKRIAKMLTRDDATTFMRSCQAVQAEEGQAFLQTEAARDFYLPTYNTQMAFAQRVGEMALLMVHAPVAAVSPLKPVLERIQTCARLEQHRIYASVNGTQTGLLTWAWLTSKCLRAEVFDTNALQAFEWSEGQHLAVVDVVMSNDTEAAIWADLAGQLYPDEDIWLLCKVHERTFFKKWAKNQRQGLLNSDQTRSAVVVGHWHDMAEEPTCAH
jgi:hemolysin-activating ACP:hemolysin acyltransferase